MHFAGKILLVDDEAHVRKYVALILAQLGAPKVIEASNGIEAVELYRKNSPDLVLLDMNMPKQDGLQTLKILKEIDPDCLVIVLTSVANRQTVEQALELGAINYLRKDTPKEEIIAALQKTLSECFSND